MGADGGAGDHHYHLLRDDPVPLRGAGRPTRRHLRLGTGEHFRGLHPGAHRRGAAGSAHRLTRRPVGCAPAYEFRLGPGSPGPVRAGARQYPLAILPALVGRAEAGDGPHTVSGHLYRGSQLVCTQAREGARGPDARGRPVLSYLYPHRRGAGLAIALPLHAFLLRRHPEDLGLSPDGDPALSIQALAPLPGATFSDALGNTVFWMLTASISLVMLGSAVVFVHQVAFMISRGTDAVLAATLSGMLGLASLPGRYVFNVLSSRISSQKLLALSVAAQAAGITVLVLASSLGWLILYVVIYTGAPMGPSLPCGSL